MQENDRLAFYNFFKITLLLIFRSTLIAVSSWGLSNNDSIPCNPADKIPNIYARITAEVVEWISKNTDGAKKSNCDDK